MRLSEIFGQDAPIEWLCKAWRADRLPHALLFAGPHGVGKASTANALAALFLCEHPKACDACGECESCRVLLAGTHPDFHVITKELIRYHDKTGKSKGIDLSIHVLRPELIEPASRKPVLGRGKVFVIEQAELMNPAAQSALLKTLEEPVGQTLIILLTDQPEALLPTIRSRCQIIRFLPLSTDRIRQELQARGVAPQVATEAAALSRGSLGLALKWIEDQVVEAAGELTRQVDGALAGNPPADLPALLRKSAEAYAQKQLERDELASKDQATREGFCLYLTIAAERVREKLKHSADPGELERACEAIDSIARAERYLDSNVNTSVVLQQLALAMERA